VSTRPESDPRIYWLTDEFYPPEIGGTGVIAANLARGLAECGLEVHVITRQTQPPCAARELIGKVDLRRIEPAGRLKGAGWRAAPAVLRYLTTHMWLLLTERSSYDVVVISGMKIIPLAAVPMCRMLGKRCIVRVESPFEIVEPISTESLREMKGVLGRLLPRVLRWLQRAVLRRADAVIAISAGMIDVLRSCGLAPERIVSIPNAIDLSRFSPLPPQERTMLRERLGIPAPSTMVLYTGRLSRAKGVEMLIEVWEALVAAHPDLLLVMVGSGRGSWDDCEAEVVAQIDARGLGRSVVLAGQSDRVHDYVRAADLFVSPSDYEGFGLALVEALAGAVPVVTTSVGVAPQILREGVNGFLCPPKNKSALAAAFEAALSQRGRWPQIGRLGRDAVAEYDLPQISARYATLARDLRAR
jgi:glycosyltransferase involved in cell wall biosynthesis